MAADFLTAWLNTTYLDNEDASVSNFNAQLLGSVLDPPTDQAVLDININHAQLYAAIEAQVLVVADGEPDPVELMSDPDNITQELADAIADGSYTGVRGLVNETTQGPVLLNAFVSVIVQGIEFADDNAVAPGVVLLSLWWFDAYTPDERPEHMDEAAVYFFDNLDWQT